MVDEIVVHLLDNFTVRLLLGAQSFVAACVNNNTLRKCHRNLSIELH